MLLEKYTSRINTFRRQVGWLRMLKIVFLKISTRIFDPYLISSYSQFGEDRLIDVIFGGREKGYYVDVGCNHPISYSNTWKLYLRGWSGIAIDPNPGMINLYRKIRPRDVAIQKAVSNEKAVIEFYFSKTSNLISGIGPKIVRIGGGIRGILILLGLSR